jgi:cobalt-zinc-cadmium efflux system protein
MHEHDHAHSASGPGALYVALALTAGFAVIEFFGGWLFGSLALMSDAGHMFSDAVALGLAAFALWVGRRPAGARHSYGFARAEVVAAFVNGLLLLALVVWIVVEAVSRLLEPSPVQGLGVALIAAAGLLANLAVLYLLGRSEQNLNTRGATLHVLGDLLGSVAALTAGAVVYFTGWQPIDPLLSVAIALLIVVSTLRLVREALHVLMEGVPVGLQFREVGMALAKVPAVRSVHDLHVWTIASGQVALSAHVEIEQMAQWPQVLEAARRLLRERFAIEHVTLQPEQAGGAASAKVTLIRRPEKER